MVKLLKDVAAGLLKKMVMPEQAKDQIIRTVLTRGGPKHIKETIARDVLCPNCGGSVGYYIPYDKTWACLDETCLKLNSIKPGKKDAQFDRGVYGIPIEFLDASPKGTKQDATIIQALNQYRQKPEGVLLMTGKSGGGKSYAASALLLACAYDNYRKGDKTYRFLNISDVYIQWKADNQEGRSELPMLGRICGYSLVVLDDLGQRTPSEGWLEFLYLVINKRMNDCLPIIITTNLTSEEAQQKIGQAILSRISSGKILKFNDKDRRVKW